MPLCALDGALVNESVFIAWAQQAILVDLERRQHGERLPCTYAVLHGRQRDGLRRRATRARAGRRAQLKAEAADLDPA